MFAAIALRTALLAALAFAKAAALLPSTTVTCPIIFTASGTTFTVPSALTVMYLAAACAGCAIGSATKVNNATLAIKERSFIAISLPLLFTYGRATVCLSLHN